MLVRFCLLLSLSLVIVYTEDLYSKFTQHDYNLEFIRLELVDYNKEIFDFYDIVTFKYNRSMAVANFTFKTKISSINKDIQIVIQTYKFYSNEYRIFPLRLQLNFCTCIARNLIGLKSIFSRCGNYSTDCIFKKGETYHACHFTPDQSKFPPMIPNGEYKLEVTMLFNNTVGVIMNSYGKVYRPIKYN